MTAFTKTEVSALHSKLDAVLAKFAEENGLVAGKFAIKYGATDFTLVKPMFSKKDAQPATENGESPIDPRYLADLRRHGLYVGLMASHVGTELVLQAKRGLSPKFKFVGMRASKAVCINLGDNKAYLWDAKFIAMQITLQTKAK